MKLDERSNRRLYDPRISMKLKQLFDLVISDWPFEDWDFQIWQDGAYRTLERQKELYYGKPKRTWTLKSKHMEGKAIDITLIMKATGKHFFTREAYIAVYGWIKGCSKQLNIPIRWGGNWDQDGIILEEKNNEVDLVHFEIAEA